jgi:Nuclease-related domain
VVHDIQSVRANRDHVVVGPPGVFVLETKNLGGLASVADDRLKVRWRDAPDGGSYVLDGVGNQVRGQAAALHAEFRAAGVRPGWVQAVVVLWSDFEQQIVEAPNTLWVHGSRLAGNLAARDVRLSDLQIAAIAAVLRRLGER